MALANVLQLPCRADMAIDFTLKHYAHKVLYHMRIEKLEARWREFLLVENPTDGHFLEGAVLLSQLGRIAEENLASLPEINRSIDDIVERVTRLVSTCSTKSPARKTITFINQVLCEEMGFQRVAVEDESFADFYIDQVGKILPFTLLYYYNILMFLFNLYSGAQDEERLPMFARLNFL